MARFPLSETPDGAEAVQTMEKCLMETHGRDGKFPFPFKQEDGSSLIGYYATLSYSTPAMIQGFFDLGLTMGRSGAVTPRNRELAILGLCSVIEAPYIAFCHRQVGLGLGITEEQWDEGLSGQTPKDLNSQESLVYRLGQILPLATQPLDEATWQEVLRVMTKVEFVGLLHFISAYRWVSIMDLAHGDPGWHKTGSSEEAMPPSVGDK